MAGLEVVVRPVVFPDIRPRPTPALPPVDDPTQGFAVIKGNGAGVTTISKSTSVSTSYSRPVETERRVDETRVYQQDDDGTVNKDNFVNLQVPNRITMNEPGSSIKYYFYKRQEEAENIEILDRDVVIKNR